MTTMPNRRITDVDIRMGERIKVARHLSGVTQQDLAEIVGVSFQQIQKYERAHNRVSAGMIVAIAKATARPVAFFFDDIPGEYEELISLLAPNGIARLLRSYGKLSARHRDMVADFASTLLGATA